MPIDQGARQQGRRGRRPFGAIPLRKKFLIVCEGEKTEPLYFEAFPVKRDVRVRVEGEGANTTSLVQLAKRYAAEAEDDPYDEVWVVFDKDSFPARQFNAAVAQVAAETTEQTSWGAAWSNQSFEYWYLLHFGYMDSDLDRSLYIEKLEGFLGSYRKNDPEMYRRLLSRQIAAIKNARRRCDECAVAPHGSTTPANAKPCTTVHLLVEALNTEIH